MDLILSEDKFKPPYDERYEQNGYDANVKPK
jgi:hypothetical protein